MTASAPWAFPLLLALPVLVYWIYPPTITRSPEVPKWAAGEIKKMGRMTAHEIVLSVLVLMAIILWVVGADYIDAATTALFVVAMMLITGIFTWDDMAKNHSAWTTIVLLACLVTMADGLGQSGFIKWFAALVGSHIGGLSPIVMILILVSVYFFSHYMFASLTAHTTTMMPVVLAVGMGIKGLPLDKFALALAMTTGIMGVMTPYATGAALPYYNSGYITTPEFWRLGTTFGFIFLAALLGIGVPLLML
jgi:L-tartrate/succinate antiporter